MEPRHEVARLLHKPQRLSRSKLNRNLIKSSDSTVLRPTSQLPRLQLKVSDTGEQCCQFVGKVVFPASQKLGFIRLLIC